MITKKIESINELLSEINIFRKDNEVVWFRGQSSSEYRLSPGALRYGESVQYLDGKGYRDYPNFVGGSDTRGSQSINLSSGYLHRFIKYIKEDSPEELNEAYYLDGDVNGEINHVEVACLGQHYKLKTMLLDWTVDATVALFFSCSENVESGSSLYLLNPNKWNNFVDFYETVLTSDELAKRRKEEIPFGPIAFESKKSNKRICRQSGYFTMHGVNIWEMDFYSASDGILLQLIIPKEIKAKILEILITLGITAESIYVENDKLDEETLKINKIMLEEKTKLINGLINEWEDLPDDRKNRKR